MMLSNRHLFAVRVSTIVLLTMFVLTGCGQEDPPENKALQELIEKAAQGDVDAPHDLGEMYRTGEGVPKDNEEAVRWYRLAAEQGLAKAQANLGVMYDNGWGVLQNHEEGVRWYRKAAEQGNEISQNNLGLAYEHGRGVTQNYVRAHMWYNLAASQATGKDRERSVKNRDGIAQKMTSEQIAEAQRLAREWKPQSSGSQ